MKHIDMETVVCFIAGLSLLVLFGSVVAMVWVHVAHESEAVRCSSLGGQLSYSSGECFVAGEVK